jgi:mono/diheme cytochrome c family protein
MTGKTIKYFGIAAIAVVIIAIVGLLFVVYSPSDVERFIATNPEAYDLGRDVYAQNCAVCHGIDGKGQFPDNPRERDETGRYGAPPHDENGHTWHHDEDLLYQMIDEGGMGTPEDFYPMPAFGEQLSQEEMESVLFYIKTFWTEEQRQDQVITTEAVRNQ